MAANAALATLLVGLGLLRMVRPLAADQVESFLRFRRPPGEGPPSSRQASDGARSLLVIGLIAAQPLLFLVSLSRPERVLIAVGFVLLAAGHLVLMYQAQRSSRDSSQ